MTPSGTFPEIARWWRRKQSSRPACGSLGEDDGERSASTPKSNNPRTLLLSVTRSQEGLAFIKTRVRSLREQLRGDDDPQDRLLLALYLEKLGEGHLEEALREMDDALARIPRTGKDSTSDNGNGSGNGNGWAKSERSRLSKALDSLRARQKALREARESGTTASSLPPARDGVGRTPAAEGWGRKRPRSGEGGPTEGDGGCRGSLESTPTPPAERFEAVDERFASGLSYEEFIETYALRGRPVVLKGGVSLCFAEGRGWDREALRQEAGDKVVPVRRWVPDSVSWARLEEAGQMPLERLLGPPPPPPASPTTAAATAHRGANGEDVGRAAAQGGPGEGEGGGNSQCDDEAIANKRVASKVYGDVHPDAGQRREPLYLHDWSLPQNLGTDSSLLADRFQVPKFFAGDMLQRLAGQGLPYTDRSHFWMALLEGKKRWLLYPKEDAPLLYPVWPEGCHDPVFEAELDEPDAARTPAALLAKGASCVLEPGDLLFVPAGCPHHVENLTDTLALSCNYVDATNVEASLKALRDQALTDPSAGQLASALGACDRRLVREQSEVPWALLKKWPRDGEVAAWAPPGACGMPPAS